ncbi:MAG: DegV family protein [Anaerolineae bacterium]|nr:DegV family protein [Anaerolineae bacterium]
MIRIVTDSTCDLPTALLERYRIRVAPINIQFGQESFQENVTLGQDEFYQKVAANNAIPTTSQPSLGQFKAVYAALAAEPDTEAILSLHITSHLSGTYDSAVVAASQMPTNPPITVFDSLSGSMGLGFMVWEAAQMAEAGAPMAEIIQRLEVVRERMRIFLSLDNLRFAQMSGRVGMVRMLLSSLLNIKPLLTVTQGKLELVGRARSHAQALTGLVDALEQALKGQEGAAPRLAVIHAQAPEAARRLAEACAERFRQLPEVINTLSIGIAVHFGPGTVGVVGYVP